MPTRRVKSQVKANVDLWLNDLLLRDGFYSTVTTGETDIYGRNVSQLISVDSPSHADNRVWQSAFKNWVHESGITPTSPISPPLLASGVTVDGTFYPKDPLAPGYNASFAHTIDFVNGRVIFDSAIAATSNVEAEFSYKSVWVDFADRLENEEDDLVFETMYKDNPMQTGVLVYPMEKTVPLPSIMLDFRTRDQDPYELGVASTITVLRGSFILWTRDSADKDLIEDLIMANEQVVLLGIDFNSAPMPLDSDNDKVPAYTSYSDFARLDGNHFYQRIYIDELSQRNSVPTYNVERGRIDFTIRVYPNF